MSAASFRDFAGELEKLHWLFRVAARQIGAPLWDGPRAAPLASPLAAPVPACTPNVSPVGATEQLYGSAIFAKEAAARETRALCTYAHCGSD